MKKKILAVVLCVAMLAIAIVGGTLAYFTDTDARENVFAVGNIEIELTEVAAVLNKDGKELEDRSVETDTGVSYTNLMPTNQIVKTPTITNTGSNDAYVRVVVTLNNADKLNAAIDQVYEQKGYTVEQIQSIYDTVFDGWGINYNPRPGADGKDARGVIDDPALVHGGSNGDMLIDVDFTKTASSFDASVTSDPGLLYHSLFGIGNWFKSDLEAAAAAAGQYEIRPTEAGWAGYYTEGMGDMQIRYVYYFRVPAGASVTLFDGLRVPAEFDNNCIVGDKTINQMAFFEGLVIDIQADAIQVEGFDSPAAAFEALQAAHPIN